MSNVFHTELEQALKSLHNLLEEQRLVETNQEQAAKLGLYYAHGATDKAENKLANDQIKSRTTSVELQEATTSTELCGNIVTAATAAATDARNTNSSASTAAVNVQSSANQLTELAGDVAALFAISSSKDYGSKIQKLLGRAHYLTQQTSEMAEMTTLQSLSTTIEAAQSRASVSLTQSKTLEKDIKALLGTLKTNFEALQTKINNDSDALDEAIERESRQEGIFRTSLQEQMAIDFTEEYINRHVNHDLKFGRCRKLSPADKAAYQDELIRGEKFWISFNEFGEDAVMYNNGTGKFEEKAIISEYRLIFTTLDDSHSFDIHAANSVEARNYFPINPDTKGVEVNPTPDMPVPEMDLTCYEQHFCTTEYLPYRDKSKEILAKDSAGRPYLGTNSTAAASANADQPPVIDMYVAKDYAGNPIKRGTPYVAFVLAVYDCDYQKEMHDTDGLLTLPSLDFTIQTQLPQADMPTLNFYRIHEETKDDCIVANAASVHFEVENYEFQERDLTELMDFQVFIIKEDDKLSDLINTYLTQQLEILDGLDEAYRLAEQKYLDAKRAYNLAFATGGETDKLKERMDIAKAVFEVEKAAYLEQERKVEALNESRLSDFFIDTDILANIPEAFGMVATPDNGSRIERIKEDIQELQAGLTKISGELEKISTELPKKRKDAEDLEGKMKTLKETIDSLNSGIEKKLDSIMSVDERVAELVLSYKQNRDLKAAKATIESWGLAKTKASKLNSTLEDVDKDYNDLDKNQKDMEKDVVAHEKLTQSISDMSVRQLDLEARQTSDNTALAALNIEQSELQVSMLEQVKQANSDLKDAQKNLADLKVKNASKEELDATENKISQLETRLLLLSQGKGVGPGTGKSKLYVAVNEKGDFTDNYGLPLVECESYTAVVYSRVKDSEPEAIPLFKTIASAFSLPKLYNPAGIDCTLNKC